MWSWPDQQTSVSPYSFREAKKCLSVRSWVYVIFSVSMAIDHQPPAPTGNRINATQLAPFELIALLGF